MSLMMRFLTYFLLFMTLEVILSTSITIGPLVFQKMTRMDVTKTSSTSSRRLLDVRIPLAGGLAGAISTAILFPIDTYKTMRQTDASITSVRTAWNRLRLTGWQRIYAGFVPSVAGAMLSSSIYFGSYEFSKLVIQTHLSHLVSRPLMHAFAAVSGNILSSIVFVPKDALKQQLQYMQNRAPSLLKGISASSQLQRVSLLQVVKEVYQRAGWKGFYPSYRATVLRNVPSAVIRFTLYEEFKHHLAKRVDVAKHGSFSLKNDDNSKSRGNKTNNHHILYLAAGSLASSISSGLTTPLDVIKTRISTGLLPPGTGVLRALRAVARNEGYLALYKGVQARMLWSALFGGIGFYSFEKCKEVLRVQS